LCWNGLYPRVTHHFASFCLLINCPHSRGGSLQKTGLSFRIWPILHPASANSGGDFSMWICPPIIHIFAKDGCSCPRSSPLRNGTSKVNGEACRHAKRSLAQVLWYCGINQSDLTSFRTFEVANSEGMSKIRLWRQPGFVRPHSVDGSLKAKKSENFSNGYGPWVKFIGYLQTKNI